MCFFGNENDKYVAETCQVSTSTFGRWRTGKAADMAGVFNGAATFNRYDGDWDAASTSNQYIGDWDTSPARNMRHEAGKVNRNIDTWGTGSVTDMESMFNSAATFNQYIGDWGTSSK